MQKILFLISLFAGLMAFGVAAQNNFGTDLIKTAMGDLEITFIGHGSLMFTYRGVVIYVDPYSPCSRKMAGQPGGRSGVGAQSRPEPGAGRAQPTPAGP